MKKTLSSSTLKPPAKAGHAARRRATSTASSSPRTSNPVIPGIFANTTPQFCRRALAQGHEFIKCNSFNRKHRIVSCPVDLSTVVWKSTKSHKKHEDKGSVSSLELRSVQLDNLHIKLKFDSRTLDFLCATQSEALEWSGIFEWLLEIVEEKRLQALQTPNREASTGLGGVYQRKARSATVSSGISPLLTASSDAVELRAESFHNPFADSSNSTGTEHQSLRSRLQESLASPQLADDMSFLFTSNRHLMYRLIGRLMEGSAFQRYKPNQKCKSRFVWCSLLLDSIMYSLDREHKETAKPRGHLSTVKIDNIEKGGANQIMENHFSDPDALQEMKTLTFSIVTPETTLHLACTTEKMRDEWVTGLRFIVWMLRNNEDGKIEEFYYWYCNRSKVSRQSMVYNRVAMATTDMPSTRKRGSSHASALVPTTLEAQQEAVVDFRSRVISCIQEEEEEEETATKEKGDSNVQGEKKVSVSSASLRVDAMNGGMPPPPPPPPPLSPSSATPLLPTHAVSPLKKSRRASIGESCITSLEFQRYLEACDDKRGLKHWTFLEELSETDKAVNSGKCLRRKF